jgi:hypothetical protein
MTPKLFKKLQAAQRLAERKTAIEAQLRAGPVREPTRDAHLAGT